MQKIAIVNRSFWPKSPAIGEALLLLSESLSKDSQPIVNSQLAEKFLLKLEDKNRGQGVKFYSLPNLPDHSNRIPFRIFEIFSFTGFVFVTLCIQRPDKVYVTTNPPIFTPLAVRYYCQLFNKKYIYHLQDIHPEIAHIITDKANFATRILSAIDVKTISKATTVITLTEQMKTYITKKTGKKLPIVLLDNPSVQEDQQKNNTIVEQQRQRGFVYCGNAGKLQRIPLLLEAIGQYINEGGQLPFIFAGGGPYVGAIEKMADEFEQVSYLGILTSDKASELLRTYNFGLLPIDDEVTNYAFPSKSSSYVFSGCQVVAICNNDTSVAEWVNDNHLGFVAKPNVESIVDLFHKLEEREFPELNVSNELLAKLTPQFQADRLEEIIRQI